MKAKSFVIRKAKAKDYSACLPLLTLLHHGDIGPEFKSVFHECVKTGLVLICEQSGKTAGVLVGNYSLDLDCEGVAAKMDAIIVDKRFRRTGIGKKLAERFIRLSRKRGCKVVKSRVNRKNRVAQKFHENLGFFVADTFEYILDFQG
jgi:ribosomal protein S18 acetylase RimI-like enzyme